MSQRYFNKKNMRQWQAFAVACIFASLFLVFGTTLARYVVSDKDDANTYVAQWNIQINGVTLSDNSTLNGLNMDLIPDTGIVEGTKKLKPVRRGHFDIVIDPTGTKVAFTYAIVVGTSKLPLGMTIDKYSVKIGSIAEGEEINKEQLSDYKVNGICLLPSRGEFAKDDVVTIRFYWAWDDSVEFEQCREYAVVVNATAWQYLGDESAAIGETV